MGVAVVLIRAFVPEGSPAQWLWLGAAALLIGVFHYVLRARFRHSQPQPAPRRRTRPARPTPNELFANELDRRWTGLTDPVEAPDPRIRPRE